MDLGCPLKGTRGSFHGTTLDDFKWKSQGNHDFGGVPLKKGARLVCGTCPPSGNAQPAREDIKDLTVLESNPAAGFPAARELGVHSPCKGLMCLSVFC